MNIPATYRTIPIAHINDSDFNEKVFEYIQPYIKKRIRKKNGSESYDIKIILNQNHIFGLPLSWFLYWLNHYIVNHPNITIFLDIIIFEQTEYNIGGDEYIQFEPQHSGKYFLNEKKRSLRFWKNVVEENTLIVESLDDEIEKIILNLNDYFADENAIDHSVLLNIVYDKLVSNIDLRGNPSGNLLSSSLIHKKRSDTGHIKMSLTYNYRSSDRTIETEDIAYIMLNIQSIKRQILSKLKGTFVETSDYVLNLGVIDSFIYNMDINERRSKILFDISFNVQIIDIDAYYAHNNLGYNRLRLNNLCREDSRYPETELIKWAIKLGINNNNKSREELCKKISNKIEKQNY